MKAVVSSLLLSVVMLSFAASAAPVTWATHAMDRVARDRAAPDKSQQPTIRAARGEWEAFQLVVQASTKELQGVMISASALRGENDAVIPAPVLLREHYVAITKSSELAPLPPGDYPDALVPQTFPMQRLPDGEHVNQPFWIDVYVPPDAKPGDYHGAITVHFEGGENIAVPFTLHVWDFTLPKVPSLKSSIFMVWRRIAEVHGFDPKADTAPTALQHVLDDYYDMLVEHRLSPHEVWATYPACGDPLSESSFRQMEAGLRKHLVGRQAGTIGLPLWFTWPLGDPLGKDRKAAMDYVVRFYRICEKLGCADRLYKIFGELDEPNDAAKYQQVRDWGRFFAEVRDRYGVKVPLLVTEQPWPDDDKWGSLVGSVDIWTAHVGPVWSDMEAPNAPQRIRARIAAGEEVWTYTALVQTPDEWKRMHGRPSALAQGQPPVWLTDYPPINYRLLGWLAPMHGITGFTYWDTSFWPKGHDVWKNNGTYPHDNDTMYNGDGFLIYPSSQNVHGREGPVASIRLKWMRESMDDHDYLHLLAARGMKEQSVALTKTFARGFGDWDNNITALYEARTQIANLLEGSQSQP